LYKGQALNRDRLNQQKTRRDHAWPAIACLLLALASGCDHLGKPTAADRPVPPRDVLEFASLYKTNCAGCHGASGELGPAPPLNDGLFRALIPEKELARVVTSGRAGTSMPAFAAVNGGALTPNQVQALVWEIKGIPYKVVKDESGDTPTVRVVRDPAGIPPKWGPVPAAPKETPAYLAPEVTSIPTSAKCEQIRKTVFARACGDCHGDRGQGDSGGGRINDPAFLALISDQALRRVILTGRSDLGMPNYATSDGRSPDFKPLTSEDVGDLVELLAYWRQGGVPGGESEVRADK
jgi:cytochrome c oxidase cbb3-type subunit III